MEHFEYIPKGVCSRKIEFELDGNTIERIVVEQGCDGTSKGLSALARGMEIEEFIRRCKGITYQKRCTSCPDQMARALERYRK